MKIIVDAGHGGADSGAIANGYIEKQLNIELSLKLAGLLSRSHTVALTRTTDIDMTLKERGQFARDNNADLLLSIHFNASIKHDGRGSEAIYSLHATPDIIDLADKLTRAVSTGIGIPYRRIFSKPKSILEPKVDWYGIPRFSLPVQSIILENLFIDNAEDIKVMLPDTLDKLAGIISGVLMDHYKEMEAMEPILGKAQATAGQMRAYLWKINSSAPDVAQIYLDEGEIEGIRGDLAFAQGVWETNFWRFTGTAKPEWNNPAGLGVVGTPNVGNRFPDWRTGIRAQTQHLKGYSTTEPLKQPCVDQRYQALKDAKLIGKAPNWEQLNGKWAVPGTTYAQSIFKVWKEILAMPVENLQEKYDKLFKENVDLKSRTNKLEALRAEVKALADKY